jgi:DHA1 family inner membrane transport protein
MTAVGNAGALAYPWLVGRLLSETASYVPGFAVMTLTVVAVAVLWAVSIGIR